MFIVYALHTCSAEEFRFDLMAYSYVGMEETWDNQSGLKTKRRYKKG